MDDRGPDPVRVLLVEDEADQRRLYSLHLQRLGCVVEAYPSAEAARSGFDADSDATPEPEVAVIDLRLPGEDGWSLVAEIRRRYPACPVVVTSVLDTDDYPAGCLSLPKPFVASQLQAVLAESVPRWTHR